MPTLVSYAMGGIGDVRNSRLTEAQFQALYGIGWVLYDGRDVTGSKLAVLTGENTLEDHRGVFARGKNNGRVDGNENPDGDVALGTYQGDNYVSHAHPFYTTQFTDVAGGAGGSSTGVNSGPGYGGTQPVGGNETRSKNLTLNVFIRIN